MPRKAGIPMTKSNANLHLTLEERRIIRQGIEDGLTKTAIAETLGKDKSTIGKEIKLRRTLSYKCHLPLECDAYRKCKHGRHCTADCSDYIPFRCKRRDCSPGACNGCSRYPSCRFDKYRYSPEKAHEEYRATLVDTRLGVNLTTSEAKAMGDVVAPLLKQGLSPYAILQAHPELGICEKTLYNYIEGGVLQEISGATVMDLRRKVSRKPSKKLAARYKKRQDHACLKGRTCKDYEAYLEEHPDSFVTQMDTVYNDGSNGPFLQTFKFTCCGVMVAIYHDTKTAKDMLDGVDALEKILGKKVFQKYAGVLLTDRGPEFSAADLTEKPEGGARRTRAFYCDPMQSGQKGSLENNHIALRCICPKGADLRSLGLTGKEPLNLALSHINSVPVKKQGGKSPLETARFFYPDLYRRLVAFGVCDVEADKIILKPYLLKDAKQ
ncbi:MAG: IS30 family transposase [Lachnospiraceae bacterium]|nr:IS30 family transposase [Lachnospiraceae bacterium]